MVFGQPQRDWYLTEDIQNVIKTHQLLFRLTPLPLQKWNQSLPQPHSDGENTTLRMRSQRVPVAQRGNHVPGSTTTHHALGGHPPPISLLTASKKWVGGINERSSLDRFHSLPFLPVAGPCGALSLNTALRS